MVRKDVTSLEGTKFIKREEKKTRKRRKENRKRRKKEKKEKYKRKKKVKRAQEPVRSVKRKSLAAEQTWGKIIKTLIYLLFVV